MINTPLSEEPTQEVPIPPTVKSGISEIQTMILGFFVTPIFLVLISVYTQTIFVWWIISGILIFAATSIATAHDRRFLFFACGSMLATMAFIIPWFFFIEETGLICYDTYLFFNDVSNC